VVVALLGCVLGGVGLHWLVSTDRIQKGLARRLEADLGRPVEAARFEVDWLGGLRLVARSVRVAEDPRFGFEHFLLAEQVSIRLRWWPLLRGRVEFGELSFERPSLNLVRNPDGQWNLEAWLAVVTPGGGRAPGGTEARMPRFERIEVEDGRVNFKRGVEKHPFAFVNVEGSITQEAPGAWRMDLEASPMRGGAPVQDPGVVRLRGRIGSPMARLRPADLQFTWEEVPLSDALRLVRGHDFGVRGTLFLTLEARSPSAEAGAGAPPAEWLINASLRLVGLHRWDFPPRERDPNANLQVEARWIPEKSRVELSRIMLEGPGSNVRATGHVSWAALPDTRLHLVSAGISLNDLLDWLRAFREGVAAGARLEGNAGLDAELSGWPVKVRRGVLATDGARLRWAPDAPPLHLTRSMIRWNEKGIELVPTSLMLSAGPGRESSVPDARRGQLRLAGSATFGPTREFTLAIAGETRAAQEWAAALGALGLAPAGDFQPEGDARAILTWKGSFAPLAAKLEGSVQLKTLRFQPAYLNQAAVLHDARLDWLAPRSPAVADRRITFSSAEAFNTRWSGTLQARAGAPWSFMLSTDRLDIADLGRWLNRRWRQSVLERTAARLPFLGAPPEAEAEQALARLNASGQLSIGQLQVLSLRGSGLRGELSVMGATAEFSGDVAGFYGGRLRAEVKAEREKTLVYSLKLHADSTNLSALAGLTSALEGRLAGYASGDVTLRISGSNREELLRSLTAQGEITFRDLQLLTVDLPEMLRTARVQAGRSVFPAASATFSMASGEVEIGLAKLASRGRMFAVSGKVRLPAELDLRVSELQRISPNVFPPRLREIKAFQLAGPLNSPRLTPAREPTLCEIR
jgi:hypothetical protein